MKISVVTPCRNAGPYLAETLASVREAAANAPAVCIEHRVYDACSTDGTLGILRAQSFARWISEPDAGQASAVNRGWREASGDVLCFLCADDLWLPQTARCVAEAFQQNPGIDVVYGDYFFLEGMTGWQRPKTAGPFSAERLLRHNFLSQPATFLRRRVFEKFGPLREDLRFCMDHEYWLRIHRATTWLYVPQPLAIMRLHADAKTSSQLAEAWDEAARMTATYGAGRRFFWKALWMRLAGQYLYRLRRSVYRRIGAARAREGSES
jgi:glycosyltransferase involved in cell wall biosynthesis